MLGAATTMSHLTNVSAGFSIMSGLLSLGLLFFAPRLFEFFDYRGGAIVEHLPYAELLDKEVCKKNYKY